MNEALFDALYIAHAGIIWAGSIKQLAYIYTKKRARDITWLWVSCLLASEVLALPRAITSGYPVWWLCHTVSTCLMVALLIGVRRYGAKEA